MDFYSQGGFTLSICSQVRDDSKEKKLVLICEAWGLLQVKTSTFKLNGDWVFGIHDRH